MNIARLGINETVQYTSRCEQTDQYSRVEIPEIDSITYKSSPYDKAGTSNNRTRWTL